MQSSVRGPCSLRDCSIAACAGGNQKWRQLVWLWEGAAPLFLNRNAWRAGAALVVSSGRQDEAARHEHRGVGLCHRDGWYDVLRAALPSACMS